MTIEIARKKSLFIYRQNPYNDRVIDRRRNVHGARWLWYARRATVEDARKYLLELEREAPEEKGTK